MNYYGNDPKQPKGESNLIWGIIAGMVFCLALIYLSSFDISVFVPKKALVKYNINDAFPINQRYIDSSSTGALLLVGNINNSYLIQ